MSTFVYTKQFDFSRFMGIDNTCDPTKVPFNVEENTTYLREAVNVDISDDGIVQRSPGKTLMVSGSYHSLWADSKRTYGFCIQTGELFKVKWNPTLGTMALTSVYTGLDSIARMQYVEVGNRVFMTNGSFIGYFEDNSVVDITSIDINETFKTWMPAGHLIEFYNNQLFVAVGSNIWVSDAAAWHRHDIRGGLIPLMSRVRMIQAVHEGMYISDENQIYFLRGGTAKELSVIDILDVPVFPGGFFRVDGKMVNIENTDPSEVVFMLTPSGIYVGGPDGNILKSTKNNYIPVDMDSVSAISVDTSNKHQVTFIGSIKVETMSGEIELRLPNISVDIY